MAQLDFSLKGLLLSCMRSNFPGHYDMLVSPKLDKVVPGQADTNLRLAFAAIPQRNLSLSKPLAYITDSYETNPDNLCSRLHVLTEHVPPLNRSGTTLKLRILAASRSDSADAYAHCSLLHPRSSRAGRGRPSTSPLTSARSRTVPRVRDKLSASTHPDTPAAHPATHSLGRLLPHFSRCLHLAAPPYDYIERAPHGTSCFIRGDRHLPEWFSEAILIGPPKQQPQHTPRPAHRHTRARPPIDGARCEVIIDTVADFPLISAALRNPGLIYKAWSAVKGKGRGVRDKDIVFLRRVALDIRLGRLGATAPFLVVVGVALEAALGVDFLYAHKIAVSLAQHALLLESHGAKGDALAGRRPRFSPLYALAHDATVAPNARAWIQSLFSLRQSSSTDPVTVPSSKSPSACRLSADTHAAIGLVVPE
ncbi:hypothetical protein Efla_001115 [Eimeria flavescens]